MTTPKNSGSEMAFSVAFDISITMAANYGLDQTTVYTTDAGDELTFAQIAMASAKEPDLSVDEADDEQGYIFDGELYTPVDSDDSDE